MDQDFAGDLRAVAAMDVVPTILEVVCRTTGMGFAAIARVTEERWIACAVRDDVSLGLEPGGELKVETTICDEIRDTGSAVVIDHVDEDEGFRQHPTPQMYGFQSYISVPIYRKNGQFFGTLCALDPKPAKVRTPHVIGMFKLFADLIGFHLHAQDRLAATEKALLDERQAAELREQFVAVLGHDLRNPLASIDAGAKMLLKMPLSDDSRPIVNLVKDAAARMSGLIDNILDFARGRLGGGLPVNRVPSDEVRPALEHVVAELSTAWPTRSIRAQFRIDGPVDCDCGRLSQLASNLVANALVHGDPDGPVDLHVEEDGGLFVLSVTNRGPTIPQNVLDQMFRPFARSSRNGAREGLGLGLYIAAEIARAHGGSLDGYSSDGQTRFVFKMPARAAVHADAVRSAVVRG